jgi:hypothetical protein
MDPRVARVGTMNDIARLCCAPTRVAKGRNRGARLHSPTVPSSRSVERHARCAALTLAARGARSATAPQHQLFVLNRVNLQNLAVPLDASGSVELNQQ